MTSARPAPAPRGEPEPSEAAVEAAIDSASRALRLPTLRDRYGEIAASAAREQLSYKAFLSELLLAECDERDLRRAARRVHEAGFPRQKTLADFDFTANPAVSAATINTLAGCGWVTRGESLCLIGDSGTGKSHLLIALGTEATPNRWAAARESDPPGTSTPAWPGQCRTGSQQVAAVRGTVR